MDSKEAMIKAATELIEERGERLGSVTVREIGKRAGVGLGLVNYHFGNKDELVAQCVEKIINGIVARFVEMRERTEGMLPPEKLESLVQMTLDFLFEHRAVSRISILSDMQSPKPDDNTQRTYSAYLPLVAACRPDWDEDRVKRVTHCLIASMQQSFLRSGAISDALGADITDKRARADYCRRLIGDIVGAAE